MDKKIEDNAGIKTSNIKWCDLTCPSARRPDSDDVDGSRTCRTFIALYPHTNGQSIGVGVYCKKLKQLVTKNSPCAKKFDRRRPKTKGKTGTVLVFWTN